MMAERKGRQSVTDLEANGIVLNPSDRPLFEAAETVYTLSDNLVYDGRMFPVDRSQVQQIAQELQAIVTDENLDEVEKVRALMTQGQNVFDRYGHFVPLGEKTHELTTGIAHSVLARASVIKAEDNAISEDETTFIMQVVAYPLTYLTPPHPYFNKLAVSELFCPEMEDYAIVAYARTKASSPGY